MGIKCKQIVVVLTLVTIKVTLITSSGEVQWKFEQIHRTCSDCYCKQKK